MKIFFFPKTNLESCFLNLIVKYCLNNKIKMSVIDEYFVPTVLSGKVHDNLSQAKSLTVSERKIHPKE